MAESESILDLIGNARIKFWSCPQEHPRLPQRVTVKWVGDMAICCDCGRTNKDPVCPECLGYGTKAANHTSFVNPPNFDTDGWNVVQFDVVVCLTCGGTGEPNV